MRMIGTLPDRELAERFQDFLIAEGKKCSLDDDAQGVAVWVHDDDDVPAAKAALTDFLKEPGAARFKAARSRANEILKAEAEQRKTARQNSVNLRDRWRTPTAADCPISVGILIICVFVFVKTWVMGDRQAMALLFFSTDGTWRQILGGEWWRLFSPVIMHRDPLHIFFNLMWWWDLGRMIEIRKGSFQLLLMTLLTAALSDILQFQFGGGDLFLGLSGVVFGLFGYVWVKGKIDPADGIGISDQSAMWMMVWFVICVFGIFGDIANWAHFGGLVTGMVFGLASAGWRQLRRKR